MQEKDWVQFIRKAKEDYNKIGAISCPAFDNELVYFNKYGWNHIIRKNGEVRSMEQQKRRILLIPFAVEIIRTSTKWKEYRGQEEKTEFWSFNKKFGNQVVIVVIRRDINRKYFFSIMNSQ
jgi:hypothetical protein